MGGVGVGFGVCVFKGRFLGMDDYRESVLRRFI